MSAVNIVLVINGPASTAISFTPQFPAGETAFQSPIAAGTVLGTFAVSPADWSGTVALSGPDAAKLSINEVGGQVQLAAAVALSAGTLNATATATP